MHGKMERSAASDVDPNKMIANVKGPYEMRICCISSAEEET